MIVPLRATYRLQLSRDFPLDRARSIVPYLARLGISHIYASPVLRSEPGSTHGYDVVDPTRLDPELGGDADWDSLIATLRSHGMGLVLDIVPNHMGIGAANPFWDDLFANGHASRYADWFDIDWDTPDRGLSGRVLVPILDAPLDDVLDRGGIAVAFTHGRLRIHYFQHSFPLDPRTASAIVKRAAAHIRADSARSEVRAIRAVARGLAGLPPRTSRDPEQVARRRNEGPALLRELEGLADEHSQVRTALQQATAELSLPLRQKELRALLDRQIYALDYWRRAARAINYRRFFDINDLVALRAEDPTVFGATHRRVIGWVKAHQVDGLRVDHVDGLLDPRGYLEHLRATINQVRPELPPGDFPLFVEKVLAPDESLRTEWLVQGTTGYEFLAAVDAAFIDLSGFERVDAAYRRAIGVAHAVSFARVAERSKALELRTALSADVSRLVRLLRPIAAADPRTAERRSPALAAGIRQFVAALGVYRTYLRPGEPPAAVDARVIEGALAHASTHRDAEREVLALIGRLLLRQDTHLTHDLAQARDRFVARLQQTSGPAAAKGVEDTALYRYAPLPSLNEVGSAPDRALRHSVSALHRANARRATRWQRSLLPLSTHDTKRSADVRARLDVLSEVPDEWARLLSRWQRAHRKYRASVHRRPAPDARTQLLAYATVVGLWPLGDPADGGAELSQRILAYLRKAAREAKLRTSWTSPDDAYERAIDEYVRAFLADRAFCRDRRAFVDRIAWAGTWNILAQTLLQLTSPGVPDIYQGDELVNPSLVDPDNRRPVDFDVRARALEALGDADGTGHHFREMVARAADGRLKMWCIRAGLRARAQREGLFAGGSYRSLVAVGAHAKHVIAFARSADGQASITIVPRLTMSLAPPPNPPMGSQVWQDTAVALPRALAGRHWRCAIGGQLVREPDGRPGRLLVAAALLHAPVALLLSE